MSRKTINEWDDLGGREVAILLILVALATLAVAKLTWTPEAPPPEFPPCEPVKGGRP